MFFGTKKTIDDCRKVLEAKTKNELRLLVAELKYNDSKSKSELIELLLTRPRVISRKLFPSFLTRHRVKYLIALFFFFLSQFLICQRAAKMHRAESVSVAIEFYHIANDLVGVHNSLHHQSISNHIESIEEAHDKLEENIKRLKNCGAIGSLKDSQSSKLQNTLSLLNTKIVDLKRGKLIKNYANDVLNIGEHFFLITHLLRSYFKFNLDDFTINSAKNILNSKIKGHVKMFNCDYSEIKIQVNDDGRIYILTSDD